MLAPGIEKPRRKLGRSARADFIERTNLGLPVYGARFSASLRPYKGANMDKVQAADSAFDHLGCHVLIMSCATSRE